MERFLKKLSRGVTLHDVDRDLLVGLAQPEHVVAARQDVAPEGARPRGLPLILEGWACRYRVLESGKRQIVGIYLPGDLCEPFGALPQFLDYPIAAVTPVTFMAIPTEAFKRVVAASPTVADALWWDLLVASSIEREHIVSLGRRMAAERLGHLLCELQLRLQMVGLADADGYEFPLSQIDISDVLGLSAVHVNRSLQDLRREGLITLRGRRLAIRDLSRLRALSLFDPSYLHPATRHEAGTVARREQGASL